MTLYDASGNTLDRAGFDALTSADSMDPVFTLSAPVYEDRRYPGETGAPDGLTLRFPSGAKVRQSEIDALYAAPTVTGVAPTTGPAAGGTRLTVNGTGFNQSATVTVGGAAATDVVVESGTRLTALTPAGVAGAQDVAVTTGNGTATASGAFTYE